MALKPGECIEKAGEEKEDSRRDQAGRSRNKTDPLHRAHDSIHRGTHPVCGEASDKIIELCRGRAYSEEEGDLDENEEK